MSIDTWIAINEKLLSDWWIVIYKKELAKNKIISKIYHDV